MKECPKCKSKELIKNGFKNGRQRYKCKECGFNPSVEEVGYPQDVKKAVLQAYLEGLGIRALARIFKIAVGTVVYWIKKFAEKLPEVPESPKFVKVMELDEMYHWIGEKKNKIWLWIAICSHSGRVLSYEMGCRGTLTGRKLWESICNIETECYCTDHYRPYKDFIPSEKHIQSKAMTWNIENLNGRIRHYLSRFHRKTKCWSKSIDMVNASLKLLFHKLNSSLS